VDPERNKRRGGDPEKCINEFRKGTSFLTKIKMALFKKALNF
jgi:hypothetical protein